MPLPGDPDAIDAACRQLTAVVIVVGSAGDSAARHGRAITADWTGLAAPLALARTQQDAANVQRVAQAAHDSVAPLMRYAEELRAAQQDYVRGEAMLAHGRVEASALLPEGAPAADAARDRAQHTMDEGAALMRAAEERAQVANDAAARALDAASSSLAGIAPAPPTPSAASNSPMAEVGNAAASFGMAVLEHPLDGLAVLGGGALAAVSAAGAVGSLALDGTGVGALAGVPLGGVSAAGVAAGVGIAGAGLLDLRHTPPPTAPSHHSGQPGGLMIRASSSAPAWSESRARTSASASSRPRRRYGRSTMSSPRAGHRSSGAATTA